MSILTEAAFNLHALNLDYTVLDIVNTAFAEAGYPQVTPLIGSTEQLASQGLALLSSAARELIQMYPWQGLVREFNLSTVADQESYTLPQDYSYFVDRTWWDRNDKWPLYGPTTPQEWQSYKSGILQNSSIHTSFRIKGSKVYLNPIPTAISSIVFEYISKYWAVSSDQVLAKSGPSADTDTSLLDPILLIKFLKLKLHSAKGLDTSALLVEFRGYASQLYGKDKAGKTLNLAGRSGVNLPLPLVPEGSWAL